MLSGIAAADGRVCVVGEDAEVLGVALAAAARGAGRAGTGRPASAPVSPGWPGSMPAAPRRSAKGWPPRPDGLVISTPTPTAAATSTTTPTMIKISRRREPNGPDPEPPGTGRVAARTTRAAGPVRLGRRSRPVAGRGGRVGPLPADLADPAGAGRVGTGPAGTDPVGTDRAARAAAAAAGPGMGLAAVGEPYAGAACGGAPERPKQRRSERILKPEPTAAGSAADRRPRPAQAGNPRRAGQAWSAPSRCRRPG